MIGGVIGEDVMERVVGKLVTAVVEDGLDGRSSEEPHGLAHCHSGEEVSETTAKGVKRKALERVVVKGTVSVGNVETMVARVKGHCCCQLDSDGN